MTVHIMWRQAYTDDGFDLTAKLLFAEKSKKKKNNGAFRFQNHV